MQEKYRALNKLLFQNLRLEEPPIIGSSRAWDASDWNELWSDDLRCRGGRRRSCFPETQVRRSV